MISFNLPQKIYGKTILSIFCNPLLFYDSKRNKKSTTMSNNIQKSNFRNIEACLRSSIYTTIRRCLYCLLLILIGIKMFSNPIDYHEIDVINIYTNRLGCCIIKDSINICFEDSSIYLFYEPIEIYYQNADGTAIKNLKNL